VGQEAERTVNVTVIGVGDIGGTISRRLCTAGHDVTIVNSRGPQSLAETAADMGANVVALEDCCADADVVILSIPTDAMPAVADAIRDKLAPSTVLVDTTNYAPGFRDRAVPELDDGEVESIWVSRLFGHPVIKAFNNIHHLTLRFRTADVMTEAPCIALPVAGDDGAAKAVVMSLVGDVGFDAIDGGSLDYSWHQQPGTPVFTTDLDRDAAALALSMAQPGQTVAWRGHMAARVVTTDRRARQR
jgi:predicted dinucleotide-binding enzyme